MEFKRKIYWVNYDITAEVRKPPTRKKDGPFFLPEVANRRAQEIDAAINVSNVVVTDEAVDLSIRCEVCGDVYGLRVESGAWAHYMRLDKPLADHAAKPVLDDVARILELSAKEAAEYAATYQREMQANLDLREKMGARSDETMAQFIERVVLDAMKTSTSEPYELGYWNAHDAIIKTLEDPSTLLANSRVGQLLRDLHYQIERAQELQRGAEALANHFLALLNELKVKYGDV